MPPKKRVLKTVRKTTPRSKSKTPVSPPPTSAVAEETPTAPASAADAEAPTPAIAAPAAATSSATPVSKVVQPTVQPPETHAAPEPMEAVATAAPPEPASKPSESPATDTSPPDEATQAAAVAAGQPSEAPPRKTTIRVRKVIKKKIIKKRVPKVVSMAKRDSLQLPETAALETPVTQSEPENPSSAAPLEEVARETENVDSEEDKDVWMEGDKEEGQEEAAPTAAARDDEEAGMSERQKRRKTEIFIGGLDRDAKEEDLRKVFGKVGEIVEVRMMMDAQTGKNKGYAFLRYTEAAQAKKAVSEFSKVEICGKLCGAAALEGNDTIFLGNIDKKWKKEDVMKLLQDIGIEKIDTVTVMADPNNANTNRGFAFLELETNRDAHIAYRKLQKKDAFGKGRNIKVAWAEPLNDPDEEAMQKVKSVYVEGIPSSWHETKLRELFKKFGEIERIVHSRDIQSAKRKDFAFVNYTTREAALSCIGSFDKELTENCSKVNIRVSLAKPVQKGKQNKGFSKSTGIEKEKPKPVQYEVKPSVSSNKGKSFKVDHDTSGGEKSSTTNELLQVLREQAAWKQGQVGCARGPAVQDYSHIMAGGKRSFSLGEDAPSYSDARGYPRARLDSSFPVSSSSYGALPHGMPGSSLPYYQHPGAGYPIGTLYGVTERLSNFQKQGVPPYGSSMYARY